MSARYRVIEPLAGKAGAFRCEVTSSDGHTRVVTIRRSPAKLNVAFADKFRADAAAALSLRHPNLAELLDVAVTEDACFVISGYVEGCDLKTFVERRKRVTVQHALYIVSEVCKGLAHAHASGVIHRAVSPRAVLLGTKGEVKVADFGLAKLLLVIETSDPGIVKGKFDYLSPEAARAQVVDHRADVFAAGIVLWELLTGRRLFLGETDYQTIELVRSAQVPPIESADPELDAIARTALAREPTARAQTATDLADALRQYAASHDIELMAGETARLVGDVKLELDAERSARPRDRAQLDGLEADLNRMTSIIDHQADAARWN